MCHSRITFSSKPQPLSARAPTGPYIDPAASQRRPPCFRRGQLPEPPPFHVARLHLLSQRHKLNFSKPPVSLLTQGQKLETAAKGGHSVSGIGNFLKQDSSRFYQDKQRRHIKMLTSSKLWVFKPRSLIHRPKAATSRPASTTSSTTTSRGTPSST